MSNQTLTVGNVVWTTPPNPGNFAERPGPVEYQQDYQSILATTPLIRLDLVPQATNPTGVYGIWQSSTTGHVNVGATDLQAQPMAETAVDNINGSGTALAITPTASTYTEIPSWVGGTVSSQPSSYWTTTAGSIRLTWIGPQTQVVKWNFRITATSAGSNKQYNFKVLKNGALGTYVPNGSMQATFTTTNTVTASMLGQASMATNDYLTVFIQETAAGTDVLTATLIDFIAYA